MGFVLDSGTGFGALLPKRPDLAKMLYHHLCSSSGCSSCSSWQSAATALQSARRHVPILPGRALHVWVPDTTLKGLKSFRGKDRDHLHKGLVHYLAELRCSPVGPLRGAVGLPWQGTWLRWRLALAHCFHPRLLPDLSQSNCKGRLLSDIAFMPL